MTDSDHVCGSCQKSKSHLRCGRCGLVYYCNINCQKKHWKRHKTAVCGVYANEMISAWDVFQCACFSLRAIPGKGFGMIANRPIKQGEIIVSEDPVLEVDLRISENERCLAIMEQFDTMSQKTREKIESLYDSDPDGSSELKVFRIFKSNCIQSKTRHHYQVLLKSSWC